MEFKLGAVKLSEMGASISKQLMESGYNDKCKVELYLNDEDFKRLDEDIYYRIRTAADDEFIPSDSQIIVDTDKVKFEIFKKGNNIAVDL